MTVALERGVTVARTGAGTGGRGQARQSDIFELSSYSAVAYAMLFWARLPSPRQTMSGPTVMTAHCRSLD